jgi:hypothetical protein
MRLRVRSPAWEVTPAGTLQPHTSKKTFLQRLGPVWRGCSWCLVSVPDVRDACSDGRNHIFCREQAGDTVERVSLVFASIVHHRLGRKECGSAAGLPGRFIDGVNLHVKTGELTLTCGQRGGLPFLGYNRTTTAGRRTSLDCAGNTLLSLAKKSSVARSYMYSAT